MSANFHTALPNPLALTTANLESPLAELDQAITNMSTGADDISQLNFGSFTAKTIATGAITGDKTLVTVDTEASAASDDLDTISSPTAGDVMMIKIANNSRVVTLRHNGGGTGNIRTHNATNVILSDTNQIATLVHNGSNWIVLPDLHQIITSDVTTATIASGVITFTSSNMIIDTEGAAATDDLTTINGFVDGAILILRSANFARNIVIKHGSANIYTASSSDITVDLNTQIVILVYSGTTGSWNTIFAPTNYQSLQGNVTTNIQTSNIGVPYQSLLTSGHPLASVAQPFINVLPATGFRQVRTLQAADTTLEGYGMGTQTVSGTPSNNFGVGTGTAIPGSMVRFQSGASSGNLAGIITPFLLTSNECYPTFRIIFRTYTSLAVCRLWIGLSSAAIGNTDSPSSAGTSFMGLRYSTVVPDSFWQFVTSDGSTTNATSTAVGIATDNTYELLISSANSAITYYFRNIANSTYVSGTTGTNLPPSGTPLGLNIRIETREAVAKSLQIYSVALYH